MSADHWRHRDSGMWVPYFADGETRSGGYASTLNETTITRRQPIGFRGANPGASCDDRGLPRIRVKATTAQ